jgi:glycosyltransferase involved in cell wall biosynthesis
VRPALWEASIFVLPSDSEALPLSLLEGLAAGLACVATAVGSVPDVLRSEGTGRVVPPRDPDALAAALTELLRDPAAAARMGERARREVEERFGLEACVRGIEEAYVIATARRSRA